MNLHLRPDCPLAAISSYFPEGFPVLYGSNGYLIDFDRINVHQLLAIADHFSRTYGAFELGETIKRLKRTGVLIPFYWTLPQPIDFGKAKEKHSEKTNDPATTTARTHNRRTIQQTLGS